MILFLAGTSDARELAVLLKKEGFPLMATVVTESAAKSLVDKGIEVKVGRLNYEKMYEFSRETGVTMIVDASHPFAEEAHKTAKWVAEQLNIPYIRYEREKLQLEQDFIKFVSSYEEAAELAAKKKGVVMLTTGSKTLEIFANKLLPLNDVRVICRMLPRIDNMQKCEQLGFPQKNIVAMQGPFSKELNIALFKHFGVTLMITKESGKVGAVDEKIEAAKELGIETIVIKRPIIEFGHVFSEMEEIVNWIKNQRNEGAL
ncbi:precorrin-6A reductase [Ureibacillus thermophilus]|jgi:precorrin-6A/cobalt-precorrin-6A reductase|uniref:Precorrin-6A reductase n=1 Tax=Ureibacillus thermophilus TaxID=367743 RepID=A0A4P6US52_9BACL|nr:precorrin-6A reductase [Ureibacillus thermophilus]QBK26119.1 precorrin-6A reductase [Ureibacillus thermophilus]